MRLIKRTQFVYLPQGTIYSDFDPDDHFSIGIGLRMKECDTAEHKTTFFSQDLLFNVASLENTRLYDYEDAIANARQRLFDGESIHMDLDDQEMDSLYDDDQYFLVWEFEDVAKLTQRLIDSMMAMRDKILEEE